VLIPPERLDEEMRILADLGSGVPVPAFDTVRLTRDGHKLDVQITVSPIKDSAGHVVGASKIACDVTRQRRAEASLRDSEERLRSRSRRPTSATGTWTSPRGSCSTRRARPVFRLRRCTGRLEFGQVHPARAS
jgi:hypothetical protein